MFRSVADQMVGSGRWFSGRFGIYLYLVLCVSLHMAPSPSDYAGAGRGFVRVCLPLLVLVVAVAGWTSQADDLAVMILEILGPVWILMGVSVVLCLIACLLVCLITIPFRVRYTLNEIAS